MPRAKFVSTHPDKTSWRRHCVNKTLRVPVVAGFLVIAAAALAVSGVFSGSGPAKTGSSHGSVLAHTAAATAPTIKLVGGTFPQSLDPGLDYTTQGSEVNWIVYTGLTTYAHKTGAGRRPADPGPRERAAEDLKRRQDLHDHPAQGPEVLRRHARQGKRLRLHDGARAQDPVGRRVGVHHAERRRRLGLRGRQGQDDLRGPGQRQDRQDRDPPDGAVRPVRQRARVPGARPRPDPARR